MYEYKVISGQLKINWSKGETVESVLAKMLNEQEAEGWEFYQHAITTELSGPGCWGTLMGEKDKIIEHQTFIFRRKKQEK